MFTKLENEKIGQFAQRVMAQSQHTNVEILAQIKEQFPDARTTMSCVAWYRSNLKKKPQAVQEVTLETIDMEIEQAEATLELLKMKRESYLIENAEKIAARKAALQAELEALANV